GMTTRRCLAQTRAASKPVNVPVPCRNTSGGPEPIECTTVRMPLTSCSARSKPAMLIAGLSTIVVMAPSPGNAEHGPLRVGRGLAHERAAAFLDHLVGQQDVLRTGVDVAVEALHDRVVQRRAARRPVREGADVRDDV